MNHPVDVTLEEMQVLLAESSEHLQTLDEGLVHLEQEGHDPQLLQAIFRAAHTLKGTAGMINPRIAELTHALETVLDGLRKSTLAVTVPLVDACLEALDALKLLHQELLTGETQPVEMAPLIAKLQALTPSNVKATSLSTSQIPNRDYLSVRVNISQSSVASAARAFLIVRTLQTLGEVHNLQPSLAEIESAEWVRQVFAQIDTAHSADVVRQALLALAEIERVAVGVEEIARLPETAVLEPKPSLMPPAARQHLTDKTVRTSVERLDSLMNLVGELITDRNRLNQLRNDFEQGRHASEQIENLAQTTIHLGRLTDQLQEEVMRIRMLPISSVLNKFPRMVRDLARTAEKQVALVLRGEETELDRSVIEAIGDPLLHLVRNAVDHGLESPSERVAAGKAEQGTILITARHEENRIIVTIEDDGRGIDVARVIASALRRQIITAEEATSLSTEDALQLIFRPGLSTMEIPTNVSGRGVGMDVVRTNIERLSGTVEVETWKGRGTRFQIVLPLTLAITQAMLVKVGPNTLAIPLATITETLRLTPARIHTIAGRPVTQLRGNVLPLVRLHEALQLPPCEVGSQEFVLAVRWGKFDMGLIVDALIGEQELVIKSLGLLIGEIRGISGASILGDGRIALIVDVPSLFGLVNA